MDSSFATPDGALATTPLEQGLVGGQTATVIFHLEGCGGRSVQRLKM